MLDLDDVSLENENPFPAILQGGTQEKIIHQDDGKQFAILEARHPEAAVHWLAVTYEDTGNTEDLMCNDRERFLDLVDYAINVAKAQSDEYPLLQQGFTIKFHCGAFETIPHAKLHILTTE
ncbi:MAG TPA: hypothetical protein ENK32_08695 [Anaerolineae bacterium]|nr:hypothetical protein [Anaerolineae bacterium]